MTALCVKEQKKGTKAEKGDKKKYKATFLLNLNRALLSGGAPRMILPLHVMKD